MQQNYNRRSRCFKEIWPCRRHDERWQGLERTRAGLTLSRREARSFGSSRRALELDAKLPGFRRVHQRRPLPNTGRA